jgi:phosphocarrier protein
VRKNGAEVSGRSIMGLMMLAAAPGAVIELSASGPQAAEAVNALADLIECKFNED